MAAMARKSAASEAGLEASDIAALLQTANAPWLAPLQERLASAYRTGRLPHALLLHGTAGSGQSALAAWAAQLVLCDRPDAAPCGACASCVLYMAGNHPDLSMLTLEDKASEIKIDQVRALSERFTLTSFRGGYKAAIIDPADKMNRSSFNALLKTLEEPSKDTLLVLAAGRIDHMPPTIGSRCQRLRIPTPARTMALAWLDEAKAGTGPSWGRLLKMSAGAPLAALMLANEGADELAEEMATALGDGAVRDPLGLAAGWFKDRPAQRLAWLEAWLQGGIRALAGGSDTVNNKCDFGLPLPGAGLNIRSAFILLDRVRATRAALDGPLNAQLLFEDLLVGMTEALAGRAPDRLEAGR